MDFIVTIVLLFVLPGEGERGGIQFLKIEMTEFIQFVKLEIAKNFNKYNSIFELISTWQRLHLSVSLLPPKFRVYRNIPGETTEFT